MGDDWQDAAFSTRHMHNRRGSKSKRSTFDVGKAFGSYEVKCPAWQKMNQVSCDDAASLELYRLTQNGEGVVGHMTLPSALDAAVVLAASRQTLRRTIETFEHGSDSDEEEEDDDDDNDDDDASNHVDRFETFEKNSFRSPKFWFKWCGNPISTRPASPKLGRKISETGNVDMGLGYLVFAGNDCRKFKGTVNCEALGWKDVPITGHKIAARSESDVPVVWGRGRVAM